MLDFYSVISQNLSKKLDLCILGLDCLVLYVDDLNELAVLLFDRLFFSFFSPFCSC